MPPRFCRSRRSPYRHAVQARADVYAAICDHECNSYEVIDRCSQRKRSDDFADVRHRRYPISTTPFLSRTAASGVRRTCPLRWMLSITFRSRLATNRCPASTLGMPPWRRRSAWGAHSRTFPDPSRRAWTRTGTPAAVLPGRDLAIVRSARLLAAYRASGRPFTLGGIPSFALAKAHGR